MLQKTFEDFPPPDKKIEVPSKDPEKEARAAAVKLSYIAQQLKLKITSGEIDELLAEIKELGEIDYDANSRKFTRETREKIEKIGGKFLGKEDGRAFAVGKYVIRIARDNADSLLQIGEDIEGWKSAVDI
jgi:hypothetical protein